MYDYLNRSDAGLRLTDSEKNYEERHMEGYTPTDHEKAEGKRPRQRMNLENGYGRMTLGISDEGACVFSVSEKRKADQSTVLSDETRVRGSSMSEKEPGVFENSTDGSRSAAIYRADMTSKARKLVMLERLKKSAEDMQNTVIMEKMPFLSVKADKAALQRFHEMPARRSSRAGGGGAAETQRYSRSEAGGETQQYSRAGAGAHHSALHNAPVAADAPLLLCRQEARLQREIQLKEQMRRQLMAGLSFAVGKAPKQKSEDAFPWLLWLAAEVAAAALSDDDTGQKPKAQEDEKNGK